jgi:hypothetical protein
MCTAMAYDTSTNRLSTVGGAAVNYDAAGNLLSDGSCTYTWDAENRITSVSGCASFTMTYNALGQRGGAES